MEPETPSRRNKTGDEPVTIDLEAVPASAGNEEQVTEEKAEAAIPDSEIAEATAETASAETTSETLEEKPEPIEPARYLDPEAAAAGAAAVANQGKH